MVVMSWRVYHILEDMVTSDVKHCGFPQTRRPFMFGLLIDFIPALIHFCPQEEKITLILYWNQSKHSAGWQNDHQPCSCLPDVFLSNQTKTYLLLRLIAHFVVLSNTSRLALLTLSSSYRVSSLRNHQYRARGGTEQIVQGPGAVPSTEDQNGHSFPGSNHSASPARKASLTDNKVYK